ncbi:MAG TPA: TlpA disulfide reductase family protein [Thermodesulfobacteriota bacterium]|nr:TlpA disulfide reductase family protein [Thermodesulfobacteriota bacterium]
MSDKWKLILIFLVLIGFISLFSLYFIVFENNRAGRGVDFSSKVGVAAQDFGLPTLRGDYVKLSDYRGKVVFLNIWATWCPPCREEMPSMESLYQRLKGRDFEMLAVSIDQGGEKVVRPFAAKYGLTFPVLLDPDSKTKRLYGLTGIPESFMIDKNGVIIDRIIGPQNWMKKEWLDYFDRIIG